MRLLEHAGRHDRFEHCGTTAPVRGVHARKRGAQLPGSDHRERVDSLPLSSGINPQSPAFRAARQACAKLNPANRVPASAETESQKQADLKFAQCMRPHGVPSYPDPSYSGNGRLSEKPLSTYGINAHSPAVQRALKACEGA